MPTFSRRGFLKTLGLGTAGLAGLPHLARGDLPFPSDFGPVGDVAPPEMLDRYLRGLAFSALDRRTAVYEALKSPEEIRAYQERLRALFLRQLGGFPERTPLNARVTGSLNADGYRIERVIYESLPGYAVTANLYLPLTPPPYPGVLFSCGHSANGKAIETYQLACALLARNGLAVLNYDPVGQGERCHYLDDGGKPRFGATQEHNLLGIRCRLAGIDLGRFMIWDGIRGIDYLQSRPDIQADRIGATGNSGGGTLTSYLMALDDRITCAAPSCYLTGFRRLLETLGPQDFEQNIFGQIDAGIDHADYILMRAPQPTLMCVATRDFFDVHGAWDVFRQAKRLYTRLGYPEHVDLVETDETHGFSLRLREGATRWMRRWLLGIDEPVREGPVSLPEEKDLLCTAEGQVLLQAGSVSLFQLLAEREGTYRRRSPDRAAVRATAQIRDLSEIPVPTTERGRIATWRGRRAESLALISEPGLWLPAVHVSAHPENASAGTILYLPDEGTKGSLEDGSLERLLSGGERTLAVDLPGLGETRPSRGGFGALVGHDARMAQLAFLLGKNLVSLRAEAILQCARFLAVPGGVHLVSGSRAAVPALHAAALEPALFASVRIPEIPPSWSQAVREGDLHLAFADAVPNALNAYDLPDLIRLIPAGKLRT